MPRNISEAVFSLYPEQPSMALLMSGAGSNAVAILEDEEIRNNYNFSAIVTDNPESNASVISERFSLPYVEQPVTKFKNNRERSLYFDNLKENLFKRGIQGAIYAGFMKVATPSFCEALPGVNVHPADLSIVGPDGLAKYRGMKAMSRMRSDLGYIRSTVHIVDNPVDSGAAISLSERVNPEPSSTDRETHQALKEKEHAIYTATLKLLGRGALTLEKSPYDTAIIQELLDG